MSKARILVALLLTPGVAHRHGESVARYANYGMIEGRIRP